eukprot:CAMPEP_0180164776 /NCGR_PEP_ID=MMETSP0986-20121125/30578_1 /TAXON_ID=697907 /ORGANISM="non described non described, Strain CCMP2293" /LENGTH=84 /DNA_ID=CAMNT_0022115631 /DNA_START=258 /DNA_END=512 /DNA_ORIENTATION=-
MLKGAFDTTTTRATWPTETLYSRRDEWVRISFAASSSDPSGSASARLSAESIAWHAPATNERKDSGFRSSISCHWSSSSSSKKE